ncbi:hypothetical protein CU084_02640 [Bacillus velezensis]|nr:hypothetical protein CU084_02640 [Bacillus velezensis]QOH64949.1 hypothetical protein DKG78_01590 [Bacillus amyloliquefaciens]
MISICLKNSSKRSSTSQAALVTDIADTGITVAGADITEVTAAVNPKKFLFRFCDKVFLCDRLNGAV